MLCFQRYSGLACGEIWNENAIRITLTHKIRTYIYVNLTSKTNKETNLRALFCIFIEKKAAQVGCKRSHVIAVKYTQCSIPLHCFFQTVTHNTHACNYLIYREHAVPNTRNTSILILYAHITKKTRNTLTGYLKHCT